MIKIKKIASAALILCALFEPTIALAVDYDIVYVRAPRNGDSELMSIPEVFDPIKLEAGTDLVLLHPNGSEEILVNCDTAEDSNGYEKCAVLDPSISFDGRWVYFSKVADQSSLNGQRRNAAYSGADIFKMNLQSRQITQLTHQEWTPNTGARAWSSNPLAAEPNKPNYIKYGVYNLGASPLPGGRIVFTSSRNSYQPNKGFTSPNLQLFVMDDDGKNVELIGHMNLGSALHPVVLRDGRIMFSSYEAQGLRDQRIWGLWYINPDGSNWGPLMSAFDAPLALHWQTQMTDGNILITEYYNTNNSGFGTFYKFPDTIAAGQIPFGSPDPKQNPALQTGTFFDGKPRYRSISFSPYGIEAVTPFTHPNDNASDLGKVTQPSGAPNNELLLVYSPGPANHRDSGNFPRYDAGLYLLGDGVTATAPTDLQLIKNDPAWNEQQPQAVVSYQSIYGIAEPTTLAPVKNDGSTHAALPAGSPYGLVGTSTFYRRDTTPGRGDTGFDGLDAFNSFGNDFQVSTNWFSQGADAGKYQNSDIHAVRVLAMEPTSAQAYGPGGYQPDWKNHANERLRILGEIPLRKFNGNTPILDSDSNPDTSFMAKLPADTPFTFQTIDARGFVLNMSQTWHQLRSGEVRNNCGGCHGHSQQPMPFAGTEASKPSYVIPDLANSTPLLSINGAGQTVVETVAQGAVDVEFNRDIKPILERSCVSCHSVNNTDGAPALLELDVDTQIDGYNNAWHRLANDGSADYGIPPLTEPYGWRMSNESRYVRAFQSRRSLLMWKIMGERLDGWTNADHPSPTIRGDRTTLPDGGSSNGEVNRADIDFDGDICPPPDTSPPLTANEKMLFARWIDLGAPISTPLTTGLSWFTDELRPTLTLSEPASTSAQTMSAIQIGMHDFYSGLDLSSLSVKASFELAGRAPEQELADLFTDVGNQVWRLNLAANTTIPENATLAISVKDVAGNLVSIERSFAMDDDGETSNIDDGIVFPVRARNGKIIMIMLQP